MKPTVLISDDYGQLEFDLQDLIENIIKRQRRKPTLAFVFMSIEFDFERVKEIFLSHGIDVLGATTSGEMANRITFEKGEDYEKKIVTMLLTIPKDSYKIVNIENKRQDSFKFGQDIGGDVKNIFEKQAIIIMLSAEGGVDANGDKLVEGITSAIGRSNIALFGGYAGDNYRFERTTVFTNKEKFTKGAVLLVINEDKIEVKGMSVCGWQGIGNKRTITKAEGNKVYEIDNVPVLDFYNQCFPEFKNTKEEDLVNTLGYHLLVSKGKHKIARALLSFSEDEKGKAAVFGGELKKGAKVQFYFPNKNRAIKEIDKQITEFNEEHDIGSFDAILLFSCCVRLLTMGSRIKDEINILQKYGNIPFAGFFTYGEIGNLPDGLCSFHNNTTSMVFIKEKKEEVKEKQETGVSKEKITDSQVLVDETIENWTKEQKFSERILFNIIPKAIAEQTDITNQLDENKDEIILGKYIPKFAKKYENVSIMVASIADFRKISDKYDPEGIISSLNETFSNFDQLAQKYSIERLRTTADIYMIVGGLKAEGNNNIEQIANMALDILKTSSAIHGLKIGIHSGPAIGGIIGADKFSFELWGKTVDLANRMRLFKGVNKIRVTQVVYEQLKERYEFEPDPNNTKKEEDKDKSYFLLRKNF